MFNRKKMTKREIDALAGAILEKFLILLANKQEDLEQDFLSNIIMNNSEHSISDEEMLMGELARLQTILMIYEDKEEYEKAALIMDKINRIKYKLSIIINVII